MRIVRRIASQPALQSVIVREVRPGSGVSSDDELLELVREHRPDLLASGRHVPDGYRARTQWSMPSSASTAWRDCGSRTPR